MSLMTLLLYSQLELNSIKNLLKGWDQYIDATVEKHLLNYTAKHAIVVLITVAVVYNNITWHRCAHYSCNCL